jgi:deoxyribose-phosphate aldolase
MKSISQYIEYTNLKPFITDRELDTLVAEAKEYKFYGVCVPPFWVKQAKREIGNSNLKLATVIGFPFGYNVTEAKLEEIKQGLSAGANELEVVMNLSALKIKMDWTKIELAKCAKLIHDQSASFKVIIETGYLSEAEIIRACKIAEEAGADFVKTSTGIANQGAQEKRISLMKKNLSPTIGVMACGGIRTYGQVMDMVEAGALRIGTSSGVEIMKELEEEED